MANSTRTRSVCDVVAEGRHSGLDHGDKLKDDQVLTDETDIDELESESDESQASWKACDDEALAEEQHRRFITAQQKFLQRSKCWDFEDDTDDLAFLAEKCSRSSRCSDQEESTIQKSGSSCSSASSLCSSVAPIDGLADYHSPEETVIIFDWDDTICPTTALTSDEELVGTEVVQELVRQARLTLERAREVADEVVIVTNAGEGWLETSCEDWLPGLLPTLDMLEFSSARSTWEPTGITDPSGWKAAAFEEIIRKFYSRYHKQSWKNIIVIGDASYEHTALAHVAALAPDFASNRCRAKSIRFIPQPTVESLTSQLRILRESFQHFVHHDGHLDFKFQSESL